MNYTTVNPKGIDAKIKRAQDRLSDHLNWGSIDVYGRVYRNPSKNKNKGETLEAYVGKNEYRDVFLNDKINATIFFIEDEQHTTNEGVLFKNEMTAVFFVNLKKTYPDIMHRADMEAEQEAFRILKKSYVMRSLRIEKNMEQIFKGINIEGIPLSNMQPYHVFGIVGEVAYYLNSSC